MIRSELIQKIAEENPQLYQKDVEKIVNVIFDRIVEAHHDLEASGHSGKLVVVVPEQEG